MKKKVLLCVLLIVLLFVQVSTGASVSASSSSLLDEIRPRLIARISATFHNGYENIYDRRLSRGETPLQAISFISEELSINIENFAIENSYEPINATYEFTGEYEEPFIYNEDIIGQVVDIDDLCRQSVKSIDNGGEIEVIYIEKEAEITYERAKKLTAYRGESITHYSTSSYGRKNNIKVASTSINGAVIEPSGIFSFNEVVGPRSIDRGYMEAHIIVGGEYVAGIGGRDEVLPI